MWLRSFRAALTTRPDAAIVGAGLLLFTILTAIGLSGSSLALLSTDGTPDESALIFGDPRPIRSDEYLVWSPIKLGQVYAGFPDTRVFGMETIEVGGSWRHHVPNRSIGHAFYSPFNLPLLLLPAQQGFAAFWWMPFFAAFLACYFWFRLLGARWEIALPGAVLIVSAPAAVWWSGWMLYGIAHAAGACALFMAATKQWTTRRGFSVTLLFFALFAAAGLPWNYQPWSIPPALFFGGVTLAWGLSRPEDRRVFLALGGVLTGLFVLASVFFLIHEVAYYEALSETVYPGSRRDFGGGLRIGTLFSSLFAATVNGVGGQTVRGTNLSELSMGWSILLPVSLGIVLLARSALVGARERTLVFAIAALGLVLTSWTLVRWPAVLARATLLTFVPPHRLAPFVGLFGVTLLVVLAGDRERWARIQGSMDRAAVAALVIGVVGLTAWTATELQAAFVPALSMIMVLVVVLAAAALTWVLMARAAAVAMGVLAAVSTLIALFVNPVMVGTGAIRDSEPARTVIQINEQAVEPWGGTWAADNIRLVPLLNGNGIDSLSSFNDPVGEEGWLLLDPTGQYESAWNRFAYILFSWEPGLPSPVIEAPSPDLIVVRVDPCDPVLDDLDLVAIITTESLTSGECLTARAVFEWDGFSRTVWLRDSRD